jgi:hypothetical protein
MMTGRGRSLRGGMGDWWSDLLFNINPSNSPIHNTFVTPIADSIFGIPLGTISNATQQGMQDIATGNFNLSDIQAQMQNQGMTPPTMAPKPASSQVVVAAAPAGAPEKFPILPVLGAVVVVGLGAAWFATRPRGGAEPSGAR